MARQPLGAPYLVFNYQQRILSDGVFRRDTRQAGSTGFLPFADQVSRTVVLELILASWYDRGFRQSQVPRGVNPSMVRGSRGNQSEL